MPPQQSELDDMRAIREMLVTQAVQLGRIEARLEALTKMEMKVDGLEERFSDRFVTKSEFEPFKKLITAMVGLTITSVVGAIVALVIKAH